MEKTIQAVAQRDRLVVGFALAGIATVAWLYLAHEAERFAVTGVCQCAHNMMRWRELEPWSPQALLPLFLMWTEMMLAMMLPAVTPLVLLFSKVARSRAELSQPYVSTAFFVAGYFAVWTIFSLAAALAQWILHGAALISPQMTANSAMVGGVIFIAAGVFQLSPLKKACLTHCCWLLMLLLFAVGVMNLLWIAVLAIFALSERIAPKTWRLSQVSGVVLLGFGGWLVLSQNR